MGQKSNLVTIRKSAPIICFESLNTKKFAIFFKSLKKFDTLLRKKGILVLQNTFNFSLDVGYLNLLVFFQSMKRSFYKRRGFIKKLNKETGSLIYTQNSSIDKIFSLILGGYKYSFLSISIKNLNRSVDNHFINLFYNKIKRFSTTIFARRYNLFIDFLKLTSLLVTNKISGNNYILILSIIFSSLSKKSHTQFLFFLKFVFKIIVFDLYKSINNDISGIKFVIKGKLQGKPRASTAIVQEGSIPNQSLAKNIDFSKIHSYTLMGAFGLKLWIYRK